MSNSNGPIVTVHSGQIQGSWQDNHAIAVFKGIPYAQPPVGELRWRPPQLVEAWEGVRPATAFGPTAVQLGAQFEDFFKGLVEGQGWSGLRVWVTKQLIKIAPRPQESEDCLYLNVRTPSLDAEAKLPVMVWIHGGDHQDGSSSDIFYDSNAIAHKGVVYVTINYRLGPMGYFTHPELTAESEHNVSGNYGTLDQIAALEWVQENITAFGGDPDNVTIFGESAGGESVAHMMTTPLARGLFHKAIMQSPANGGQMLHLFEPFLDYPAAEEIGVALAAELNITGDNQIERLRQCDPQQIYDVVRKHQNRISFYPVIDGYVLPKSPFVAFQQGNQAKVPLIVGSNADEGTLIYPLFYAPISEFKTRDVSQSDLPAYIPEVFGDETEKLVTLYPGLDQRDPQAEQEFLGDNLFGEKARLYAGTAAEAGQPTYFYLFTRVPPSPDQTAGAYHAAELPFVHGTSLPVFPMSTADKALSRTMIDYWTEFAKSGNPHSTGHPEWNAFDPQDPQWMVLGVDFVGMRPVDREERYQILKILTQRHIEAMQQMRLGLTAE